MAEWLKAHAWKACIRATVSWVRIPLPPPHTLKKPLILLEIFCKRDQLPTPLPIRSANVARRERIPAGVAKVAPGRNARRARLERRLENLSLH